MNYTLNFQNRWEHEKLLRHGGQLSPLERELRIVKGDQYTNIDYDQNDDEDLPTYDFVVNKDGDIIPNLSDGKRKKFDSICLLPAFVDVLIAASRIRVFLNAYLSRR